jgi:hypothetical protein
MIEGRYWLLDAAVESGVPLGVLDAPNLEEAWNRGHHRCTAEEIARSIATMVDRGELLIRTSRPGRSRPEGEALSEDLILERIGKPGLGQGSSWYELTELGGACWEAWARPDWSRYNNNCMSLPEYSKAQFSALLAATEPLAQELFELESCLKDDCDIIAGSVRRKALRPWRATYWKTLPEGYLIAFRSIARPDRPLRPTPRKAWDRWCELRRWYDRPDI